MGTIAHVSETREMVKIVNLWKLNPSKNFQLYRISNAEIGVIVIIQQHWWEPWFHINVYLQQSIACSEITLSRAYSYSAHTDAALALTEHAKWKQQLVALGVVERCGW